MNYSMTLLDKLNPTKVNLLMSKRHTRPSHYERAMVSLTNHDNVFQLTVGEAINIIDMCELDECASGLFDLYKYFKND